jgi:hypothetical protein
MPKDNFNILEIEESILIVDISKLTLPKLRELVNSKDDKIILYSNKKSVVLDLSNPFDHSIIKSMGDYEKVIKRGVGGRISSQEHIFSADDADIILTTIEMQQEEQKAKLALVKLDLVKLDLNKNLKEKRSASPLRPIVTPPSSPPRTPPLAPKKPKGEGPFCK